MSIKRPSIPKGTRDFSPAEMVRRNYIFDIIKEVFKKYGYLPLETPAMEYLDTLLGKYGEEGDKLLFKILNSGDFMQGVQSTENINALSLKICEKGLRYDLTVPFARYIVQHQHELVFPFKRYQIQPVWRADRPQKGRYREFYQCDADVIGSNSLLNEIELIQIMDEVFRKLAIKVMMKINNRKILAGISEYIGEADRITDITVAIDKLEKTGEEKVFAALLEKGLSHEAVRKIEPLLKISGPSGDKLETLASILSSTEHGSKGIEELRQIFDSLDGIPTHYPIEFDITLARGLNYYTGAIFEVKAADVEIGSLCGGGRYDDLTGIFGLPGISGVGVSFGADRLYDVMNQLDLFPTEAESNSDVLIANFGEKEAILGLSLQAQLRDTGILTELYPDTVKLGKQISYASSRHIPFVILLGENEIKEGKITVKRLSDGEQQALSLNDLILYLKRH